MRDMKSSGIDWLGSIPSDWKLRKIKFCFDIVKDIIGYEGPPVLACTNTGIKVKDLTYGSGQIAKDYSNYQWVRPGDFVMNNLDLVGGWIDVSSLEGVTSPDYRVFRARGSEYDNGYYRHLFQLCYMDRIFRDTSNVVEGMGWGRMQAPVFKNFVVPVPSASEQQRIALYLTERCQDIDCAINAAEESLSEYRSLKASVISDAVTVGINPDVPLKEIGIKWTGSVPSHWAILRAKELFFLTNERGNATEELLAATQAFGMYPQRLLEGVVRVAEDTNLQEFRTVHINDFVISLRSFQGGFERSDYEGVCSPAYQTFRAAKPIDFNYFKYYFKSPKFIDAMNSLTVGIREGRTIKFADFSDTYIAVPSLEEQIAIADYLDEKCAQIDAAIDVKRSIIDELKAYKKSLVYEYVTGKREAPCQ